MSFELLYTSAPSGLIGVGTAHWLSRPELVIAHILRSVVDAVPRRGIFTDLRGRVKTLRMQCSRICYDEAICRTMNEEERLRKYGS
jgi:hypothetical protein